MHFEARVRETFKWNVVTAFGGHEYCKYEWRRIPVDSKEEADRHPYLDVQKMKERGKPEAPPGLEVLRAQGKAAGIPRAGVMKRETLETKLAAIEAKQ